MDSRNDEVLRQIMYHFPLYRHALLVDARDFFHKYPDLKHSHIHAMIFLMVSGETTMSRLAALLRLEKGSLTAVAERLVSAGLAERHTDPADRRKAVLRLTEQGRTLAEEFRKANARHFDERIARLSEAERAEFAYCLTRMNELLRRMIGHEHRHCLHPDPDFPAGGSQP